MHIGNLKIGARLSAGFGMVLMLMVILIAIALVRLTYIGELNNQIGVQSTVVREATTTINVATLANARRVFELLVATDMATIGPMNEKIEESKKSINEAIAVLDKLVTTPQDKTLLAALKENRVKLKNSYDKVVQLVYDGQNEDATKLMVSETMPALNALREPIKMLAISQKKYVQDSAAEIEKTIQSTRLMMLVLGIAAVLMGLGWGYWITRSITLPIDEALKVAQTVAAGDLTSRIAVTTTDETGHLLQALKQMQDNLIGIIGQVRTGTDTIATASGQIASGNLDLSSRTEEQASSLEETASSMEELTSTVKQNSDNAYQANVLALSASAVAQKGGGVVAEVVDTMGLIHDSARKIVEIISTIDGIAFQTNILALNASVEAARAGEQGRGFAVVAAEVRNLAQRSAAAARQIKILIDDSVEKVDIGSRLVDQAGVTMQEIVQSVKLVTDIMGEITTASKEQTSGIEQINQAICQMDEVTQQNAALVEEAAAAAESLQDQAAHLAEVVSVFKFEGMQTENFAAAKQAGASAPQKITTRHSVNQTARAGATLLASKLRLPTPYRPDGRAEAL